MRSKWKTCGLATSMTMAAILATTLGVSAPVLAASGTVSGTVRAGGSTVPAGSVQVAFVSYSNNTCTSPSGQPLVGTATDASGQFAQSLNTSYYYKVLYKPLTTAPNKALFRWYTSSSLEGNANGALATCLTVTSSGLTGINLSTDAPSVMFTGTLKTSTGAIVSNANVFLSRTTYNWYQSINGFPSKVSETGTWELTGVDVGESNLYMQVVTPAAFLGSTMFYVKKENVGYTLIPAADLGTCGEACKFGTSLNVNTLNMDLRLPVMGQITGVVSGPTSPVGENEVCVTAYKDGASIQTMYSFAAGTACTNANGQYNIGLTYGTYRLSFVAQRGTPYMNEWHNNVSQDSGYFGATTVTVSSGSPTATINATLDVGKSISGRVTDSSGAGIPDVTVTALVKNDDGFDVNVNYGRSASDGTYTIYGLKAGTYRLMTQHPDYGMYWLGGTRDSATEFTVGQNDSNISGKNIRLPAGFSLSGTISTDYNIDARVCVSAYKITDSDFGWGEYVNTNCVNAPSAWILKGLQPGSYRIRFDVQGDLRSSFLGGMDIQEATVVPITNSNVSDLNITLASGKALTGKIVNLDPSPVANSCVTTFSVDQNSWGPGTYMTSSCTGTNGEFTLRGLPSGKYKLQINAPQYSDYVPGFLTSDGKLVRTHTDASEFEITGSSQRVTPLPTVTFQKGPKFTAIVKDGSNPVASVCVSAFRVNSNFGWGEWGGASCSGTDGKINIRGLIEGAKYKFQVTSNSGDYSSGWHRAGAPTSTDQSLATEVTLNSSDTSIGDISLVAGIRATGKITNDGIGLYPSCVQALEDDGTAWGRWSSYACTNPMGEFVLRGLNPTSTYRFRVDIWKGDFKGGFIKTGDGLSVHGVQNQPDGIQSIGSNGSVIDIGEVGVTTAPSIQGVVSSTSSSKESNVCINAFDETTSQWAGGSCSMPNGTFAIRGLETGHSYLLEIWTQRPNLRGGWYNGLLEGTTVSPNRSSAQPVTVTSSIKNLKLTLADGGSIVGTLTKGLCVAAWITPGSQSSSRTNASAVSCASDTNTFVLRGLDPATTYYLQVFSPTGATVTQTNPDVNDPVQTGANSIAISAS